VTSQRSSGSAATRFARRQRYRIPLGTPQTLEDRPFQRSVVRAQPHL